MAEKKSSRKGLEDMAVKVDQPMVTEAPAETKPEVKEEAKKPDPPAKPVQVAQVTFDRWFNSTVQKGKHKPHHKAGMMVFAGKQLRGRRSVDEWNKLFEKY